MSEGPTTRSRSSVQSRLSSTVDRGQGEGKGKQKAGDNPMTKCKMDSVSLTGQALQRLEKRQRCDDWKASVSKWVEEVGY